MLKFINFRFALLTPPLGDFQGVKPILRGLGGYTRRVRSRAPTGTKRNRERPVPLQKSVTKASKRVLTLPSRLGGCSRKPSSGQTVDNVNIPARELGTRLCTRATASSHEGTTRPAEALRNALRPRRSQTTPPRPRGLHPPERNATERGRSPCKKVRQSLQASTNTPFEARGLLSGTIIRGTPKTPNLSW